MDLAQQFQEYWKQQFPHLPAASLHLLLAVSGGIDSVVLADLLYKAGFSFTMAHGNFQLRGEESERDELFVRALAEKYGVPVLVKRFDTAAYAASQKQSIQEAARELRYNWFREIVNGEQFMANEEKNPASRIQHHISRIATAHHANDNIETLLLNFFRGTGIGGLHGILPEQGDIIRPLLFAKRNDIKAYAAAHALHWVEDSSNASDKYARNYFRLNLVPALQQVFPNVEHNLLQNIERFKDAELLYHQALTQHTKKLLAVKGNEVHIPVLKLQQLQPLHTLVWEISKPYGFHAAQTGEIIRLLQAANGSYVASATHRIIRNRNWLIIAPNATETAAHVLIDAPVKQVAFPGGALQFDTMAYSPAVISQQANVACLDTSAVRFPLLLRKWKQGDYFYPLGMRKKKKISRFLIDNKLSATAKEKVWVLESDKKIIWVAGYRIDDRFKLSPSSTSVLKITYTPLPEK